MDSTGPRCAGCSYDLAGLADEGAGIICPECGAAYEPGAVRRFEPWPRALWIAARLCGACAAFMGIICAAERLPRPVGKIAEELSTVAAVAAPVVVLGVPIIMAHRLAWRHAHPRERGIVWAWLALAGVGGNLLIVFVGSIVRGVV
jgi:hypothetical protein